MKVRFGSQVAELGWTELWNNVGNFIPWTPAYWKPRACSLGTCKIALSSQMSPPGLDHLPSVELIINGTCSASGNISPCDGPWLTCQSPIMQPPLSIARLGWADFQGLSLPPPLSNTNWINAQRNTDFPACQTERLNWWRGLIRPVFFRCSLNLHLKTDWRQFARDQGQAIYLVSLTFLEN